MTPGSTPTTSPAASAPGSSPRGGDGLRGLRAAVLGALGLVVVLPLAVLVGQAFADDPGVVFRDPDVLRAGANSLVSSTLAAILSTLAGAAIAVLVDRTDLPGRRVLHWLVLVPFLIPPFIGAMAWMALLAVNGPVNQALRGLLGEGAPAVSLFGGAGVVALLTVHATPVAYLVVGSALARIPGNLVEAARIAGAPAHRVVADVLLPLLRPGLVAAFMLTLVSSLSDFGIPALIGLPAGYTTLTTLVYRYLASSTIDNPLPVISMIGVILLVLAIAVVLLQRRDRDGVQISAAPATHAPLRLGRARWLVAALAWGVVAGATVLPLLALVAQALLPAPGVPFALEHLTLDNFAKALGTRRALDGIANSGMLAGLAALVTLVLGTLVAVLLTRTRHRTNALADVLTMLPQALPGLVIATGWLLVAPRLGIFNTPWVILAAYVMAFLALVVQQVRAPLQQVPASLEEAARVAGARPLRALLDVPARIGMPAAAVGAAVVFLTAVRELTISILLVAPGTQTLGVVIFNLQQAGSYNAASALAALVAGVGVAGLALTASFHRRIRS